MSTLVHERSSTLTRARSIVDQAKSNNRDLTDAEQAEIESAIEQVHQLDRRHKSADVVLRVVALGGPGREPDYDNPGGGRFTPESQFLGRRCPKPQKSSGHGDYQTVAGRCSALGASTSPSGQSPSTARGAAKRSPAVARIGPAAEPVIAGRTQRPVHVNRRTQPECASRCDLVQVHRNARICREQLLGQRDVEVVRQDHSTRKHPFLNRTQEPERPTQCFDRDGDDVVDRDGALVVETVAGPHRHFTAQPLHGRGDRRNSHLGHD